MNKKRCNVSYPVNKKELKHIIDFSKFVELYLSNKALQGISNEKEIFFLSKSLGEWVQV